MKILLSAYACEPNKGSEPEIAWSWIKFLSKKNENKIFVITREKNKKKIDKYKFNNVTFLYYDLPNFLMNLIKRKKNSKTYLYFWLWQFGIFLRYYKFINIQNFDFIHHLTLGTYRFPSFLSLCNSKFIFGPVAGGETVPKKLLNKFSLKYYFEEKIRHLSNMIIKISPLLNLTFFKSKKIFLTTNECLNFIPRYFHKKCSIMPAISNGNIKYVIRNKIKTKNIYFSGRLVEWKGIHILLLVLQKINKIDKNIKLNVFGDGYYNFKIKKFIKKNKLQKNIILHGHLKQNLLFKKIKNNDLLIFPTLRDSGGYVIIEALNNNIDVITTNSGGPDTIIKSSSIPKVNVRNKPTKDIVNSFVNLILKYYKNYNVNKYYLNKYLNLNNKFNEIYK